MTPSADELAKLAAAPSSASFERTSRRRRRFDVCGPSSRPPRCGTRSVSSDQPVRTRSRAADELRGQSGVDAYDVAVVLGSGWKEGAVALGEPTSVVSTSSLSGFVAPTVAGHYGEILSIVLGVRTSPLSPVACTSTRATPHTKWSTPFARSSRREPKKSS